MFNRFSAYLAGFALIGGAIAGWKVRDWQCDAAYAKALEKAEKQRQDLQGKIDDISTVYQIERDKADVVVRAETSAVREIYKTLPAPAPNCSPDIRVIRMLESSIGSANASASGKSSD